MGDVDIDSFRVNRYRTYEKNEKYCVAYFYKGSIHEFIKEFVSESDRTFFIQEDLIGFRSLD